LEDRNLAKQKSQGGGGFFASLTRLVVAGLAGTAYYYVVRPKLNAAGTLPGEATRKFPGDDLIPVTNFETTRAIDIEAPVDVVWSWIAQIGRDKSGYYGLDSLSNNGIPSVSYLRQDLPAPQVGNELDGGYRLLDLNENEFLVYGAFDLPTPIGQPMERTTLLLIEKRITGTARLIIRTRAYVYGTFAKLYVLLLEVLDYLDAQAMLKNTKERAEMMQKLSRPIEPAQQQT
jgi:hypothetical protein